MNILITNISLGSRTGTETFVRDLALKLRALGHFPMVYTTKLGKLADEIKCAGIPVVSEIKKLPCKPEIIHGHHHVQTVNALLNFTETPGIFVCHDRLAKTDIAPLHRRIYCYVAVDYNCRQRLTHKGIAEEKIRVIYNSVDTDRFRSRVLPLSPFPKRALVFSNYAFQGNYLKPVINACRKLDIKLDVAGSASATMSDSPENILGGYDLIFGKARCAIEAMATGAAVILCDYKGLGQMVTISQIEMLRSLNFGMLCLTQPIKEEEIIRQIKRYDPVDAAKVSSYIRQKATLADMVQEYLGLYRQVIALAPARKMDPEKEFEEYFNSLSGQAETLNAQASLDKVKQIKWFVRYYSSRCWQLIRKSRWFVGLTISRVKPFVYNKIMRGNIIADSDLSCRGYLPGQSRNIDKILTKISLAERMLLDLSKR